MCVKYYSEFLFGDFPCSPVIRTLHFHPGSAGLIPGQGARIPHAIVLWPMCEKKKKRSPTDVQSVGKASVIAQVCEIIRGCM